MKQKFSWKSGIKLFRQLRPSFAEVDYYARLILRHEQRPPSALDDCRREAEIHLWTVRSHLQGATHHGDNDGGLAV